MQSNIQLQMIAQGICDKEKLTFQSAVANGQYKETFHVIDGNGHSIALKVYKPNASRDRPDREIEAMHRCNHQNIARLLSINEFLLEESKYLYITEEYLSGGTLSSIIDGKRLSRRETLNLGNSLIDALEHLYNFKFGTS